MNFEEILYNAARNYCVERHAYWSAEYQKLIDSGKELTASGYSDDAWTLFPRYQVLSAILTEIESLDSDSLPEYSILAELLILAGNTANSVSTLNPLSEIGAAAIAEERLRYADAIRGLTPDTLFDTPQLPYRRVLSKQELSSLWIRLKHRWGADGAYIYPLGKRTDTSLYAFDAISFISEFPESRLRAILRSWGINRVFELREIGNNSYLVSIDAWQPFYNGSEGCSFDGSIDWILVASHEGSITTGGALTEAVLSQWADASMHQWAQLQNL